MQKSKIKIIVKLFRPAKRDSIILIFKFLFLNFYVAGERIGLSTLALWVLRSNQLSYPALLILDYGFPISDFNF